MTDIIKRYLFDFRGYAKEINDSLRDYYIPKDHPIPGKVLLNEMEKLLVNLAQSVIRNNTNRIVPNYDIDEEFSYQLYGAKTQLDPVRVEQLLMEYPLLDKVLEDVHEIVKENPWHLFIVRKGIIEDFGDWRIIEWEKEHLTEDGKYVSSKSTDRSVSSI